MSIYKFKGAISVILLVIFSNISFSQTHKTSPCKCELAGKYGDITVSVKDILANPLITISGCDGYTITSFQMVIAVDGSSYVRISNNDHLTDEMLSLIQRIKKRSGIIIQAVHYKTRDGQEGIMPGINLNVYP